MSQVLSWIWVISGILLIILVLLPTPINLYVITYLLVKFVYILSKPKDATLKYKYCPSSVCNAIVSPTDVDL